MNNILNAYMQFAQYSNMPDPVYHDCSGGGPSGISKKERKKRTSRKKMIKKSKKRNR